mgnify:CR=1 FL=1
MTADNTGAARGPWGPHAILMVDDEPQACKWFARLYGNEFTVLTAASAHASIDPDLQRAKRGPVSNSYVVTIDLAKARQQYGKANGRDIAEAMVRWLAPIMSFTAVATSEISTRFPTLRFGFFEVGSSWLTYVVTQAHKVRDDRDRKAFTQSVLRERKLMMTLDEVKRELVPA